MELLVDFNWLYSRSLFAFENLTNEEGIPTGGMYGTIKTITSFIDMGYKYISVFLDDYPDERKKLFEGYKANREPNETREKAKKCNQSLFEILNHLGCKIYKVEGKEADDLIASRAMELAKENKECIIFSSDKDLQQLMTFPQIKVSSKIEQGKLVFKTVEDVIEKVGCEPQYHRVMRPFRGDQSDGIPSAVPRVQAKVILPVAKSIQDNLMLGLTLDESYSKAVESNKDNMTKVAYEKFVSGKNQYIINFLLADLLKWYHSPIAMEQLPFRELNDELLYVILDRFQLREFKEWYVNKKMFNY